MLRMLGTLTATGLFAGLIAGCDVGTFGAGDDTTGTPDSRPPPGSPDASTVPVAVCKPTVIAVGNGNHNEGQDCISAGCHAAGGDGPTWSVAGTLYTTAAGGIPQVGATISIRDATGLALDLPTQQNGNFYTPATLTLPVTVYASECPGLNPMVATTTGSCNTAGCHDGVAATGRIYLP
jgi:hypothetical protein